MALKDQIMADLKEAMKNKEQDKLRVLRSLKAKLLEKEISERKGGEAELSDEQAIEVLMKAAKHGHLDIVQYLLDHGADVNVRDNRGTSALYWATSNGHHDIVQLLIQNHSDVDVIDDRGWSAKDQASSHHYDDILHLLEEAGA